MSYILGSATERSVGRIGLFRKSNRAMTQAEMTARGLAGRVSGDGTTVELLPSAIQLKQWLETSGNKGHVHIPDGARLVNPQTEGSLQSLPMVWAGSPDPKYMTGVDGNAFAPSQRIQYLAAVATVSGTFNIGDGVVADRYAAGVTIGTTMTDITLLDRFPGATNRKLVFTPTSSYSGTVTAAARGGLIA